MHVSAVVCNCDFDDGDGDDYGDDDDGDGDDYGDDGDGGFGDDDGGFDDDDGGVHDDDDNDSDDDSDDDDDAEDIRQVMWLIGQGTALRIKRLESKLEQQLSPLLFGVLCV